MNESPRHTYAEEYLTELEKLNARITASEQILASTKEPSQIKLAGDIIRRDKEALRALKLRNNIPLNEDEKLAA